MTSKDDCHGKAEVIVVIPNWNGGALLDEVSLPSLYAQAYSNFSIVVVDNASVDGSVSLLTEKWPAVTVLSLPRNLGFAAAVNRGIRASTSEFVALVNNDVCLDSEWLSSLVSAARRYPYAASFASRIMDYEDRSKLITAGDYVTLAGNVFPRGHGARGGDDYDHEEEVFSACAAAAMYRRSAFRCVGLFDEDFFAYFEDVDWGFRARRAGLACYYVPSAVAYHRGSATSGRVSGLRVSLMAQNGYWLILKNFPWPLMLRQLGPLAFIISRRFYRSFRDGDRSRTWKGLQRALILTPRMIRKRVRVGCGGSAPAGAVSDLLVADRTLGSARLERLRYILPFLKT
jgi:GT2 family glycosyltransferase